MAFQSMMNGSECSTGNNPLNQLLKQQSNKDNSVYNQFNPNPDQSTSTSTSIRSQTPTVSSLEADRFYSNQQSQQSNNNNFDLQALRRELLRPQQQHQHQQQQQQHEGKAYSTFENKYRFIRVTGSIPH
jgi:peroxin-5